MSWRPHSWFARSKTIAAQRIIVRVQACDQRTTFFVAAFSLGDSLLFWRTLVRMGHAIL